MAARQKQKTSARLLRRTELHAVLANLEATIAQVAGIHRVIIQDLNPSLRSHHKTLLPTMTTRL
jgi:hypothetical protein